MENLPLFINLLFGFTVLLTIIWFYLAARSKAFLILILIWTVLQSILGISGIYENTEAIPPSMVRYGVLPTLLFMALAFLTRRGRTFIDAIQLKTLTYAHSIRIPVEVVLALLYHQGWVSVYMTFEGTNFDLFSGITAPLVAYFAFRGIRDRKLLIAWNILCLLLLLNVVITAVFALPSPFQQLAFDQPNRAVLFFPFNLLPTVIVPLVLFGHLVALRQLMKKSTV